MSAPGRQRSCFSVRCRTSISRDNCFRRPACRFRPAMRYRSRPSRMRLRWSSSSSSCEPASAAQRPVALLRSPHFGFEQAGRPLAARAIDALDRALHQVRFGGGWRALAALAARWGGDRSARRGRRSAGGRGRTRRGRRRRACRGAPAACGIRPSIHAARTAGGIPAAAPHDRRGACVGSRPRGARAGRRPGGAGRVGADARRD